MIRSPFFSKRLTISPITFFATASGLIMEKVRSIAMQNSINTFKNKKPAKKREFSE
jgi:hypothetical protein